MSESQKLSYWVRKHRNDPNVLLWANYSRRNPAGAVLIIVCLIIAVCFIATL